jgi:ACT domain-containing protein
MKTYSQQGKGDDTQQRRESVDAVYQIDGIDNRGRYYNREDSTYPIRNFVDSHKAIQSVYVETREGETARTQHLYDKFLGGGDGQ